MSARIWIGAALGALLAGAGLAGDAALCPAGQGGLLALSGWSAARRDPEDRKGAVLHFAITSHLPRAISMVEGYYVFRDPLDRPVWRSDLPENLVLAPGETHVEDARFSCCFDRLPDIDPALVRAAICVAAVVFSDGEVARFGE